LDVSVDADNRGHTRRQMQVGRVVLDREGEQLSDIYGSHTSPWIEADTAPDPRRDARRSYYSQQLRQSVTDITEHLSTIRERVRIAAQRAGRSAEDVTIVAVSKQQSAESIQLAYRAGQRHFGESYAQEAEAKLDALAELDIVWHFIGRIQGNKTRFIAERFHWVHTVDRARIARRLAEQRPYFAPPLNVLIQVNLDGEPQKGGVAPNEVEGLAERIAAFD